jgi:hypothetical protein
MYLPGPLRFCWCDFLLWTDGQFNARADSAAAFVVPHSRRLRTDFGSRTRVPPGDLRLGPDGLRGRRPLDTRSLRETPRLPRESPPALAGMPKGGLAARHSARPWPVDKSRRLDPKGTFKPKGFSKSELPTGTTIPKLRKKAGEVRSGVLDAAGDLLAYFETVRTDNYAALTDTTHVLRVQPPAFFFGGPKESAIGRPTPFRASAVAISWTLHAVLLDC